MIKTKERILWIDIAKGIAILSVIIAHTIGQEYISNLFRGLLYTFHLPIFFVLSAYTSSFSTNKNEFVAKTRKSAKHLLIPMCILFAVHTLIYALQSGGLGNFLYPPFWKYQLLSWFYTSGVGVHLETFIPPVGAGWFLMAMFLGHVLFDWLQLHVPKKWLFPSVIALHLAGIIIGVNFYLPFSFDVALVIMLFFYTGYVFKEKRIEETISRNKTLLLVMLWLMTYLSTVAFNGIHMELAMREYTLYPICFISSILGCYIISILSYKLSQREIFNKTLGFIGKNSMILFCIHAIEFSALGWWRLLGDGEILNALARVIVDICIFLLAYTLTRKIKKNNRIDKTA